MPRPRTRLKEHLTAEQLKARYRSCRDAKEARRWHALWLVSEGYTPQEAARLTGLQASWVRRILHSYNENGPEGLIDGHRRNPGGAKPRLSAEQMNELREQLREHPPDGGLWTGPKVAAWIEERTGKKTYPQLGWVYLKNLAPDVSLRRRRRNGRVKRAGRSERSSISNDTNL
ncbi:MAG TPA: helix-turn-helix domain-containing protein [Blastocatellia bacterium]|nr:helix-turn-helix domain-containing protein [Blastocatellia bacterium]